jgi:hypothetical protein
VTATLEELRELSRRSRRAQRWGFLAILAVMLAVPLEIVLARYAAAWGSVIILVMAGLAFVAYAYVVGQERGAFRRVFARLAQEKRGTRTLVPEAPARVSVIEK